MRQFADGALDRPATAGLVHALFELLSLLIMPPPRIGFLKSVLRPVLLFCWARMREGAFAAVWATSLVCYKNCQLRLHRRDSRTMRTMIPWQSCGSLSERQRARTNEREREDMTEALRKMQQEGSPTKEKRRGRGIVGNSWMD